MALDKFELLAAVAALVPDGEGLFIILLLLEDVTRSLALFSSDDFTFSA